ncbi:hypothetical protein P9139_00510 [Curtobacterium flaccumfaciens]|nr:hypothetical protein P9139_00510 [Curtobacterium flaccumfaciens]
MVRSSHSTGARTRSPGKIENPDGTSTRRAICAAGTAAFAWYIRIADPIVSVAQYSVSSARTSSRVYTDQRSPSQSLHDRSFSTIHAASPAGESFRPTAAVCGLVRCIIA